MILFGIIIMIIRFIINYKFLSEQYYFRVGIVQTNPANMFSYCIPD